LKIYFREPGLLSTPWWPVQDQAGIRIFEEILALWEGFGKAGEAIPANPDR